MRPAAALLTLLLAAVLACAPTAQEGIRLDLAAPISADRLEGVRGQVEARLDVLRPGTAVRVQGGGLFVEMPPAEATDPFIERLTAPGRVAIVPIPAGQAQPAGGARFDFPPLIGPDGFIGGSQVVDASGGPALNLELSPAAAAVFGPWTAANVGDPMVITFDGVVLSVPTINEPIPGGQIQVSSGPQTPEPDWAGIAAALASGPLEVELRGTAVTR